MVQRDVEGVAELRRRGFGPEGEADLLLGAARGVAEEVEEELPRRGRTTRAAAPSARAEPDLDRPEGAPGTGFVMAAPPRGRSVPAARPD